MPFSFPLPLSSRPFLVSLFPLLPVATVAVLHSPPSLPASLNRPTFQCAEIMIPVTRHDKIEAACPACLADTSDALIAPWCNSLHGGDSHSTSLPSSSSSTARPCFPCRLFFSLSLPSLVPIRPLPQFILSVPKSQRLNDLCTRWLK